MLLFMKNVRGRPFTSESSELRWAPTRAARIERNRLRHEAVQKHKYENYSNARRAYWAKRKTTIQTTICQILARSDLNWDARFPQLVGLLFPRIKLWLIARILSWDADIRANRQEQNRRKALQAYHCRDNPYALREDLLAAIRRVERDENRPVKELRRLTAAAREIPKNFFKKQARVVRAKLTRTLRRRLENSMLHLKAGQSKSKMARDLLGCDLDALKLHLESQFLPGMGWQNHGFKGWHVDHRKPLAAFNLSDPEQQKQAFHFSNLQPLWWKDNLAKGDKF